MAKYNTQCQPSVNANARCINTFPQSDRVTYQTSSPTRAWNSGNPSSNTTKNQNRFPANYRKTHTPEYYRMLEKRKNLPIWPYKKEIMKLIQSSQVVIIEGETGSGKSTQVPQWCLELDGMKQVVCTQPRRIAAISLAQRVAQEMDVRLGQEVGYVVRFERKVAPKTLLRYVTDGILLRQVMQDRILSSYDIILIDEVHERRSATDVLLGVIKDTLPYRTDLKLIIMSATLNVDKFCEFFDYCPTLNIPGKTYPVDIIYSPKVISCMEGRSIKSDQIEKIVHYAIDVAYDLCAMNKTEGDILIFVSGKEEIDYICENLVDLLKNASIEYIDVIPLYGYLPYNSQQKIFEPPPHSTIGKIGRKCIVSTNIAETSITIEGVVFVIDSGKVKLNSLAGGGHMKSLLPVDISQSSANQRAGRAGRTQPGICYRLYPESEFLKMELHTTPEILRCDLSDVILQLKVLRINIEDFQSIDPPSYDALESAMNNLKVLGALDSRDRITLVGTQMSMFPVEPEVARMLVASKEYACQEEILTLAAMLSGDRAGSLFIHGGKDHYEFQEIQSKLYHSSGDHLTYINVYNEFVSNEDNDEDWCEKNYIYCRILWEAERIRKQLLAIMTKLQLMPSCITPITHDDNHPNIMKAILTGYIGNIAQLDHSKSYGEKPKFITVRNGVKVVFHPSSVLSSNFPEPLVCYSSCIRTNVRHNYISLVSYIQEEWYDEIRNNQLMRGQAMQAPPLKPVTVTS